MLSVEGDLAQARLACQLPRNVAPTCRLILTPMSRQLVELHLLGSPTLAIDGRPAAGRVTQRRRIALLAVVGVAHRRGVSRDRLLGLLWPDQSPARGRRLLSDAVYLVRQAIGDALVVAGDDLRFDEERMRTDVALFEDALAADDVDSALALYRGPLLDGFYLDDDTAFGQWLDAERARIAGSLAALLDRSAAAAAASGDVRRARELMTRRSAIDPLDAEVALRLVGLLERAGDNSAALHAARAFAERYRTEWESDPPEAITDAMSRIHAVIQSRRQPPSDPAARAAYLRGMRLGWSTWSRGVVDMRAAVAAFNEAIALDPSYPPAHAGLASMYLHMAANPNHDVGSAYAEARAHASRALALDADLAQAHAVMGHVLLYADWDWDGALARYTQALALNPSLPEAQSALSWWYALRGRGREAIAASERACELDPWSSTPPTFHAYTLYWAGAYMDAIRQCDDLLAADASSAVALLLRGLARHALGDARTCADLDRAVEAMSSNPFAIAARAWVYAQRGDPSVANAVSGTLSASMIDPGISNELRGTLHVSRAIVRAAVRDIDGALHELEAALNCHAALLLSLDVYPMFADLRGRPPFESMRRRVGLEARG